MSQAKPAGQIGVWGCKGSGKSTYLLDRLHGRGRVIALDVTGDLASEGFKLCKTVDQVRVAMLANWGGFRIVLQPRSGSEMRTLNQLCGMMTKAQTGYKQHRKIMTLAVDEMADAFPAQGALKHVPNFARLCSLGRHDGIEVFGCSQRIAEVHSKFRGNCSEAVVFINIEPNDKKRSADTLGLRVARVEALQPLQFLHRLKSNAVIEGTVTPGRRKKQKT
jgi:hypothetical protein